jgi:LPS export ABC transporter protein LptC
MGTDYKKRRNKNRLLLILPIISTVVIGLVAYAYITSRREFKSSELNVSDAHAKADLAMGSVHQVSTRDGRTEWVLDASSAEMVETENRMNLKDITMIFYPKGGGEVHMKAGKGTIFTQTNDVEVSEGVVLAYDRYRLYADLLIYDKKNNLLTCDKPVKIATDTSVLTANAMTFDMESRNSTFNGNISGTIRENFKY